MYMRLFHKIMSQRICNVSPVHAKMNPFCGFRIFKENIINIDNIAFAGHIRSTKIVIFRSVRKRILGNGQMLR